MKTQMEKQQIAQLLRKFMAGETSVAEEDVLAQYFRTHEVDEEWAEYKEMFALFDDGKILQSQEVHLNQASALNHTALVLGNYNALTVTVGCSADGHPVGDVVTTDNHATGMNTRVADTTFQFLGKADRLPHPGIIIIEFCTEIIKTLQTVLDRDFNFFAVLVLRHLVRTGRDELGKTVTLGNR